MTTTPHDALFKAAFSCLHHARGLLQSLVPEPLSRRIAWESLRVESGVAVSGDDLGEQRMDLVYSARAGKRRIVVYVLAEHQSKVDTWMAFRLLCYLVSLWKTYRSQHPRARKLPAILPIVVHHGPGGWTAPVAFEDLIAADRALLAALGPHVPRFRFLLDDLSRHTDAELKARSSLTAGGRMTILSLKHGRDPIAVRIQALSPNGRAPSVQDVLAVILRYILETSRADPATVRALLAQQVGHRKADEMLTTAEKLRREGRKEGRDEGKREALMALLRQRFGRLPAAATARIDAAGAAALDRWFGRVLTAESLDAVLGPARPARKKAAPPSPTTAPRSRRRAAAA